MGQYGKKVEKGWEKVRKPICKHVKLLIVKLYNFMPIYRRSRSKPKTYNPSPKYIKLYFSFDITTICCIRLCRIHLTPTSIRSDTPQLNTTYYTK